MYVYPLEVFVNSCDDNYNENVSDKFLIISDFLWTHLRRFELISVLAGNNILRGHDKKKDSLMHRHANVYFTK